IAEAKKKQADLVTKKILAKGDNNDKTATSALSDADKALPANNFADVKAKVKVAETALAQAEKAFMDEQAKTKKILDDAQNKFNQLKTTKQIEANSGEDKNITKLLADANASFKANDFKKTQDQVKAALDAMAIVENAFKKDQMDVLQSITDASNRQKKLTSDKILLANGDEEKAIIKTIADAQNAFKASDLTATKNELVKAHILMDEAEARHSSERGLVEQMIQTAKDKHAHFIDSDMLTKGSEDESKIEKSINSAESNLLSDLAKSKEFAQAALDALDAVEQENAKERALQLLAQAKNDFATFKELHTLAEDDETAIAIESDITDADTQASNKKYLQTIEAAQHALDKMNAYDERNGGLLAASKLLTLPNGAVVSVDGAKTITDAQGRETILPQYYTVTKREPLTDCFWRIAGYDFVYGNPLSWEALYEANIEILRERGNPDLIYPGQVLIIPSLRGERREGAHVEGKQYIPFSEAEVITSPEKKDVSPVYVN
ncbi:MAG: hypothetical protein ACRC4W_01285, partial [Treponemataceae bacterium]